MEESVKKSEDPKLSKRELLELMVKAEFGMYALYKLREHGLVKPEDQEEMFNVVAGRLKDADRCMELEDEGSEGSKQTEELIKSLAAVVADFPFSRE